MIRRLLLGIFSISVFSFTVLPGYAHTCTDTVPLQVLILGNSITYHGAKAAVGWSGNWGMAASAVGKDYVHLLQGRIKKASPATGIKSGNIADSFERQFWKYNPEDFKSFSQLNADLIILEIGENINDALALKEDLGTHLEEFIHDLSKNENLKVCLVGSFWPNRHIDQIMKNTCIRNHWEYVDLQGLYQERKENTAIDKYKDQGVGRHPSDQGMENIANRIWNEIQHLFIKL